MAKAPHRVSGKLYRRIYLVVLGAVIGLTLMALIDQMPGVNWGLGWSTFFIGFVISAFGLAAYPLCSGCCDWEKDHNRRLKDG